MQRAGLRVHAPIKVGDEFGDQTVVGGAADRLTASGRRVRLWSVQCRCGFTRDVLERSLRDGVSRMCSRCSGMRAAAVMQAANTKHGLSDGPEHVCWLTMKARCGNPKQKAYKYYGGRGITVCDRWLHGENGKSGFECFYEDMGPKPSPKHTIERLDNNAPYGPGNCEWRLWIEQNRNRRNTVMVDGPGGAVALADLVRDEAAYKLVHRRLFELRWPLAKALSTPAMRRGPLPRRRD